MTRTLHWFGALLIVTMATVGVIMTKMPEGIMQARLYRFHVGLGLITLVLVIVRLVWRYRDAWPAPPPGLSPLRALAFKWNHILLYAAIVVLLASGVATLLSSGLSLWPAGVSPEAIQDVPPRNGHALVSKVFIALLLMHVGGVLHYQLKRGDTLSRMGVTWFKR